MSTHTTNADAALIAQAPALLAFAEKALRYLIAERDCFYEGIQIDDENDIAVHDEDQGVLDHYDRKIAELRALIGKSKGKS